MKHPSLLNKRVIILYNSGSSKNSYAGRRGKIIEIEADKYLIYFSKAEIQSEQESNKYWFTRKEFVLA